MGGRLGRTEGPLIEQEREAYPNRVAHQGVPEETRIVSIRARVFGDPHDLSVEAQGQPTREFQMKFLKPFEEIMIGRVQ